MKTLNSWQVGLGGSLIHPFFMTDAVSFKTRVANEAIRYASIYKEVMIDNEYLVFSHGFTERSYYILKAYKTNYLHLIGVHTELSPAVFFDRCLDGTLTESDFDFCFAGKKESEVKGSVRRKIKSLSCIPSFFSNISAVEEKFSKGHISCALADTDGQVTIGYAKADNCVPMTLLHGNELTMKAVKCDLLLSRKKGTDIFDSILIGEDELIDQFSKDNPEILVIFSSISR